MCCFAQPVESVSDTNLFARLSSAGKQFLVYQMKFRSQTPNAMILPLPVATPADEQSIEFISLKDHDNFFKKLDDGFPYVAPPTRSFLGSSESSKATKSIQVHEVGDFIASFVPTVDDFSRLDPQFVIPKESWDKIPTYSDYGFAVFQLKSLQGKPHPMAFEFKTRFADKIFFPTIHIHDGEVHASEKFDHTLYLQHQRFDESSGEYHNKADGLTGYVRSKWTAGEFMPSELPNGIVDPALLVHRRKMRGVLANRDVVAEPLKLKSRSSGFLPMLPFIGTGVAALAGLGWFFKRRNQVRMAEQQNKTDDSTTT